MLSLGGGVCNLGWAVGAEPPPTPTEAPAATMPKATWAHWTAGGGCWALAFSSLEVAGGGSGRGAPPLLASALGVAPLQRFPVEAEDML